MKLMKLLRIPRRMMATIVCLGGLVIPYWRAIGEELVRPVVGTRFSITAPSFVANLTNRPTLEATQAQLMATLCENQFRYLDWKALTNAPSTNDPPWILKGSLIEVGQDAYPEFVVVFESPRSGLLLRETLYPGREPTDTQDPRKLDSDLQNAIRRVLTTDDIRDNHLQKKFLATVPIARRIEASERLKRIVFPTRSSEVRARKESLLRAQYEIQQPDGPPVEAVLDLAPSGKLGQQFTCAVVRVDLPGFDVAASWHAAIPQTLSNAVPDSVRVFMDKYVQDYLDQPSTMDGLVTELTDSPSSGGNR